jgi:hypothetical protein
MANQSETVVALHEELRKTYADLWSLQRTLAWSALNGKPQLCAWAPSAEGAWSTGCGNLFAFEADGPIENSFRFCCYCGNPLEVKP